MPGPVISVSHLGKTYGSTVAVDDVSLEIHQGEIFGLIGPNGAGKTTTMECVEGLRKADRGTISVLGLDPRRDGSTLRQLIGVQHQEANLQKRIKVWEAVDLWSTLYSQVVDTEALLAQLGLEAKRNAWFMTLSGGQKQRLFIALALIHDPEVVFLDEMTTGLDPQARRAIWGLITGIKERGKTVFLTTQYLEEADQLADRVGIIDAGAIVGEGTPDALKAEIGNPHVEVVLTDGSTERAEEVLSRLGKPLASRNGAALVELEQGAAGVAPVVRALDDAGLTVASLELVEPTLDDVFLAKTGEHLEGADEDQEPKG